MKSINLIIIFNIIITYSVYGQLSINTDNANADASAIVDVKSTTKGVLVPRMSTAQRTAITAPATGLFLYDLTTASFWLYNGTSWEELIENDAAILKDSDENTKIEVEASTDEDTIRLTLGGVEKMNMAYQQIQLLDTDRNTFVGFQAGNINTGTDNSFLGYQTGLTNQGGSYNTFAGYQAGKTHNNQDNNTYLGAYTGENISWGNRNTMIGAYAGSNKIGGNNNVFIGYGAGQNNATGANNVFIGYTAGQNETGSNKLYIDNSNTTTPLIYGDFSTNSLTINGQLTTGQIFVENWVSGDGDAEGIYIKSDGTLGVNTNTPDNTYKLVVDGDMNVSGDFEPNYGFFASAYDRKVSIATGTISSTGSISPTGHFKTSNISNTTQTGTGTYQINFVAGTFIDEPIITATPYKVSSGTGYSVHVLSVTTSSAIVQVYKHNGSLVDAQFSFLAIGER